VLEGAAALSRRAPHTLRGIAAWRAEGFTFGGLSNKVLKQYGPPTLAIVWFNNISTIGTQKRTLSSRGSYATPPCRTCYTRTA